MKKGRRKNESQGAVPEQPILDGQRVLVHGRKEEVRVSSGVKGPKKKKRTYGISKRGVVNTE